MTDLELVRRVCEDTALLHRRVAVERADVARWLPRPGALDHKGRRGHVLVAGGGPLLDGATMMERRAHFLAEYDWIRTGLMFEPRGHDMMSGGFFYPPTRPDTDIGILFIETSGCLPMCGHGPIGMVTFGVDNGLVMARLDANWFRFAIGALTILAVILNTTLRARARQMKV